ncbi:NCS2 family permease [Nitratidesulfovibrio vulgaris]|jgi:AGZA family xanthine/uracil permease-like MFS transporter|nr:NCS2 family permease [Nitratidesulfovibrio vulgaris]ABM28138.1 Xanthine/uracil/vitamin C permease [Nitratidesulfovibrio vulgaris DP4]ADP87111.1 Xanthine/uracil/vitamin C permease [Nitratidesulfovibrio vulgaris RCH1]WCB48058.1 NCS2 family permease [Nitratidesulfovibrio vulgaris]GEB80468.1 xanthine/uracil permease [Desulfovibrio desulfuricans]
MAGAAGVLERLFRIREKGSTVRTEILGGITTFVAVSYIIFVNPSILADAGIPKEAAIASTIWAATATTLLMGLWANFPVAVAPGMGLNAFFAYYVCGVLGLPWQVALGAVFISGVIFLLLTVTRVRQIIIDAVPMNLKCSIVVGIGLFIAFIGLKSAGIVVSNPATFVTTGNLAKAEPLLACTGLILTAVLMARNVRGAILIGILVTTGLGMAVGAVPMPTGMDSVMSFNLPSLTPTLMQLDIMGAIKYGLFSILFTFTIVDLFDNMGTLIGLSRKAGLMDDKGHIPNLDKALVTDSVGTVLSSFLGTSTVTSYVESAAGIAEGARTGLAAVVTAILFMFALVFAPLVGLVPAFATAPALVIVGALMMMEVRHVDFTDFTEAFPAFMTIVMMPLTFSIASGFGFGFISYAFVKTCSGRAREVSPVMWLIAIAFIFNFALRSH